MLNDSEVVADKQKRQAKFILQVRQQIDFTPIPFALCRAALHQRGIPPKADSVVIFVHGLNGGGYSTWGEFPERMFVSTYGVKPDVAVFDYFSGIKGTEFGVYQQRSRA